MFTIELIRNDQLDQLNPIWLERADWLEKHAMPMWDKTQFTVEGINKKYETPLVFVVKDYDRIVGGFLLLDHDSRYWKEETSKAYYLHKLVVKVEEGGKGYSHKILDWIKGYGKKQGKEYIRLDYEKEREYLNKLYEKHGFKDVEQVKMEDGSIFMKAECKV